MVEAHRLAAAGAPAGTAVQAEEQSGGRGTNGRTWHSPPGGVWVSVVLLPPDAAAIDVLSIRLGLALAELLTSWLPTAVRLTLKWPNDLLLDGRKVGGILCEARWRGGTCQWVVAGVGINLRNPVPDLPQGAARLADLGVMLDPIAAGEQVIATISRVGQQAGWLDDAELAAWQRRDALSGQMIDHPLAGQVRGITARGGLVVVNAAGEVQISVAGVDRRPL